MIYFDRLRNIVAERPDFTLLIGPEELLAEAVLLGGHGGVSGGANLCPQLYVDLYNAAAAGDLKTTSSLHRRVIELASAVYSVGPPGAAVVQGIKTALSILGICSDLPAEPFHPLSPEQRKQLEKALDAWGSSSPRRYHTSSNTDPVDRWVGKTAQRSGSHLDPAATGVPGWPSVTLPNRKTASRLPRLPRNARLAAASLSPPCWVPRVWNFSKSGQTLPIP